MEKLKVKARARYAFAAFLGRQGKRCTPERLLVLDTAFDSRKAFTAHELLSRCLDRPGELKVSRATVFNTLPLLVQASLLRRNDLRGSVTYEAVLTSASRQPRLTLVCTVCGNVQRRSAATLAPWLDGQNFRNFSPNPETAVITVYGTCARCRRQGRKNTDNHII